MKPLFLKNVEESENSLPQVIQLVHYSKDACYTKNLYECLENKEESTHKPILADNYLPYLIEVDRGNISTDLLKNNYFVQPTGLQDVQNVLNTQKFLSFSKGYLTKRFFIYKITDYSNQAMTSGFTDFVPYVYINTEDGLLKVPQRFIGTIKVYVSKICFVLVDREVLSLDKTIFNAKVFNSVSIRVAFKKNFERNTLTSYNSANMNLITSKYEYLLSDTTGKNNSNLYVKELPVIEQIEGSIPGVEPQNKYSNREDYFKQIFLSDANRKTSAPNRIEKYKVNPELPEETFYTSQELPEFYNVPVTDGSVLLSEKLSKIFDLLEFYDGNTGKHLSKNNLSIAYQINKNTLMISVSKLDGMDVLEIIPREAVYRKIQLSGSFPNGENLKENYKNLLKIHLNKLGISFDTEKDIVEIYNRGCIVQPESLKENSIYEFVVLCNGDEIPYPTEKVDGEDYFVDAETSYSEAAGVDTNPFYIYNNLKDRLSNASNNTFYICKNDIMNGVYFKGYDDSDKLIEMPDEYKISINNENFSNEFSMVEFAANKYLPEDINGDAIQKVLEKFLNQYKAEDGNFSYKNEISGTFSGTETYKIFRFYPLERFMFFFCKMPTSYTNDIKIRYARVNTTRESEDNGFSVYVKYNPNQEYLFIPNLWYTKEDGTKSMFVGISVTALDEDTNMQGIIIPSFLEVL